MTYCFEGKVRAVEERFEKQHVSGAGPDAIFKTVSLGWWVIFEGWPASMRFAAPEVDGASPPKPDFDVGDTIDLTATRRVP